MDVKKLPWVSGMLTDLGLVDLGDGLWSSEDNGRSLYLGLGSVVIFTSVDGAPDFETQHPFPAFPDEAWLFDAITEHIEGLGWRAQELDPKMN